MDLQLAGRVAIVTGASRGLGRAAVESLVAEGARVVAAARSKDALDELAAAHPGRVHAHPFDATDREQVRALVGVALDAFGRLDVIVNNAGAFPAGKFIDGDDATWDHTFELNIHAPMVLTREAGKVFLAQGSGKVINVASISGLRGKPILVGYSASKAAIIRFTEALGAEWAKLGVQVNTIAPGGFDTEAQSEVTGNPDLLKRRIAKIPAGRMGYAEEIGPLVCYLASPLSDFVTGATFVIDGGEAGKL